MSRIRKLIWTFKQLRHVAQKQLLNQIYESLAQSLLTYCIPIWGGATKTKFLELERAQRSLLKVMYFKRYRFSTENLYKLCDLLTVRKLYVQHTILKTHRTLKFNLHKLSGRRKYMIAPIITVKTTFAKRQFTYQSAYLYNEINKHINIYPLTTYKVKLVLKNWLKKKSYNDIESILLGGVFSDTRLKL